MVVTDLKLQVSEVPAYTTPREALRVTAELFDRDKKISRNSFLRFVDFEFSHVDVEGNEATYVMTHTGVREDKGQYLYPLEQKLAEGMHRFVISADSRTFNRSKRFDMQVQWPVEVKIEAQQAPGTYELKLRAREEYLKPDGLVAEVDIEAPDGTRDSLALEFSSGWLRTDIETNQEGLYRAHVKISAQSHAGEIQDVDLGAFSMLGVYRAPPVVEPEMAEAEQVDVVEQEQKSDAIDWKLVGVVIVAINLSLLLLLVLGWWLLKMKKDPPELDLKEEEFGA